MVRQDRIPNSAHRSSIILNGRMTIIMAKNSRMNMSGRHKIAVRGIRKMTEAKQRLVDIALFEGMKGCAICRVQIHRQGSNYADVLHILTQDIPTVDAVEVVRCKDCIHFSDRIDENGERFCNHTCVHRNGLYEPAPMRFCSFGERR